MEDLITDYRSQKMQLKDLKLPPSLQPPALEFQKGGANKRSKTPEIKDVKKRGLLERIVSNALYVQGKEKTTSECCLKQTPLEKRGLVWCLLARFLIRNYNQIC